MAGTRKGTGKPHATNKVHFACFSCQKAFKQQGSSNWDSNVPQRPFPCPDCKQPMVRLGRYFKAPRRNAIRQWLKIELLYKFGERFESSFTNISRKCKTLPDTVNYLTDQGLRRDEIDSFLKRARAKRNRV
jgi:hypothetical protein